MQKPQHAERDALSRSSLQHPTFSRAQTHSPQHQLHLLPARVRTLTFNWAARDAQIKVTAKATQDAARDELAAEEEDGEEADG